MKACAGSIRQMQGSIGYVELIYAVQNNIPLRQRQEFRGSFPESVAGRSDGSGRVGSENAGGFSRLDHQRAGQGRISHLQLHMAADSGSNRKMRQKARFWLIF